MSVLRKAARIRRQLFIKTVLQFTAAAGLAAAGLGIRAEPLILIVCLALAGWLTRTATRTIRLFRRYGPQAKAEKILLSLVTDLRTAGFRIARQRRLPAGHRNRYLIVFSPDAELAFVIGLAGVWPPGRTSLDGPQQTATELSGYGTPHVPVILAAFTAGVREDYPFGVLAVSPARLTDALIEVCEQYHQARQDTLTGLRAAGRRPEIETEPVEVMTPC